MNSDSYAQFDKEIDDLDLSVFDNASADFEEQFKLDYIFTQIENEELLDLPITEENNQIAEEPLQTSESNTSTAATNSSEKRDCKTNPLSASEIKDRLKHIPVKSIDLPVELTTLTTEEISKITKSLLIFR